MIATDGPTPLNGDVIDGPEPAPGAGRAKLRILIVANYDAENAATVCDHVNAFLRFSEHRIYVLSRVGEVFRDVDLDMFDAVIIHYSINMALWPFFSAGSRRRLAGFKGLKAAFIQDEYRFVNDTCRVLDECGVSLVFTCLPPAEVPKVYGPLVDRVRFQQVLTGYVPEWLLVYEPIPLTERPVMVGYRGRTSPAWLGEAGREKQRIGERFQKEAARAGLKTDIAWSEKSRLYGSDWLGFIRRCRAVLASESGASVFDFDGRIAAKSESFAILTRKPGERSTAEQDRIYADIRQRYFEGQEDQIDIAQISPRIFEAFALRTLVIAYPGRYSGVMEPWKHYVPLAKDHSNVAEVIATVRDVNRSAEIIAAAYADIAVNPAYSFRHMIGQVDPTLREAAAAVGRKPAEGLAPTPAAFHKDHHFMMVENPHGVRPRRTFVRRHAGRFVRLLLRLTGQA